MRLPHGWKILQPLREWLNHQRMKIANRSIRHLLALWYIGILFIILCLFGVILYTSVSAGLRQNIDKQLALQANGVADTIFAFWRAQRALAGSGPGNWEGSPSDSFIEEITRGRLVALANRWAKKTGQLETERSIQLIDHYGHSIAASPGFDHLGLALSASTISKALSGETVYQILKLPKRRVRLLTLPIVRSNQVVYLVQAAAGLDQMDESLRRLRGWLLLLIPLTLMVTSYVGWFLATTAMRPIGRMISKAQQIDLGHLSERIDVPKTDDELEQLAMTFNDMMDRLEKTFNRMRQFSAAASHELRTPLTIMKGELEVALRKPRERSEYERVLRTHLEAIDEMSHTVAELLMLARTEAVESAIEWQKIELGQLAQHAGQTWRPLAQEKKINLEVSVENPVWIRGERRLLERVITNLVDNALRHTPSRGQVSVNVQSFDNEACLTVKDTGSGIPADKLPTLFDRFFKPRPEKEDQSSTGLGLGLCRWITEVHHGRIEIQSPPGEGVIVRTWFPKVA